MKRTSGLVKIEDTDGLNYIIQSKLNHLEFKGVGERYSIKYVKSGTEVYWIDKKEKIVNSENFILTNPHQEIEIYLNSETDITGICYYFEPKIIRQIKSAIFRTTEQNLENNALEENVELDFSDVKEVDNIPIHHFHTRLYDQLNNLDTLDKLDISAFLMKLAESLVTHKVKTLDELNDLKSIKATTKTELYRRIQLGRQFIHDNVNQVISLQDIASAACLSEYYFHRTFRNFFHVTPHQYHNKVRIQRAHELINHQGYKKKEAAYACGFTDAKYFSKSYGKWLNLIKKV